MPDGSSGSAPRSSKGRTGQIEIITYCCICFLSSGAKPKSSENLNRIFEANIREESGSFQIERSTSRIPEEKVDKRETMGDVNGAKFDKEAQARERDKSGSKSRAAITPI